MIYQRDSTISFPDDRESILEIHGLSCTPPAEDISQAQTAAFCERPWGPMAAKSWGMKMSTDKGHLTSPRVLSFLGRGRKNEWLHHVRIEPSSFKNDYFLVRFIQKEHLWLLPTKKIKRTSSPAKI